MYAFGVTERENEALTKLIFKKLGFLIFHFRGKPMSPFFSPDAGSLWGSLRRREDADSSSPTKMVQIFTGISCDK